MNRFRSRARQSATKLAAFEAAFRKLREDEEEYDGGEEEDDED